MKDFLFKLPTKIVYGVNSSLNLKPILDEYGISKVMVVTDAGIAGTDGFKALVDGLKNQGVEYVIFSDAVADPPIEAVDEAAGILKESGADGVIAVGGGSSIDTSKAMCMLVTNEGSVREYLFGGTKTVTNRPIPLIAVPTTAGSGSEVTAASVITDNQRDIKLSVTHEYLMPLVAVVDPMMHVGMPPMITASTGMDALTHAIEAYVSLNAEPISDMYATTAIKMIGENIRTAMYNPTNIEARGNMAIASVLAAAAFVNAGLGAVHGISQSMGGIAHTPHGIGNSLLLPYVMELNVAGNPGKFAKIAELLGEDITGLSIRDAADLSIEAVKQMSKDLRIPSSLKELAIPVTEDMFDTIVDGTMGYRLLAVNPVKVRREDVYEILNKANH
ncbi:MAG: iron-containing alcohol dehydrogenase [Lachnospiraceae bacterium]|nr:iron-containing alcohol dehydrogenase [Lachnospiraceae bacterium]